MAETWSGEFYCVKCKEKREAEGEIKVSAMTASLLVSSWSSRRGSRRGSPPGNLTCASAPSATLRHARPTLTHHTR